MVTWKLWASVPTLALWEAVALVLEIEPRSLVPLSDGWMAGPGRGPFFEPSSFPSKSKRADFDKALSFAERAANAAGPIYLRTGLAIGMNKRTALVSLSEVVAYFISVEWPDIPAPLLTAANNAQVEKPTDAHRDLMVLNLGEAGADAYFIEKARQQAIDEAEGSRQRRARTLAFLHGAPAAVAVRLPPPGLVSHPPPKAQEPRTWKKFVWPYMVDFLVAGRFATAKALDSALLAEAGSPESPFDQGTGPVNRGSLVIRATGKKLDLKTIQNNWQELREAAKRT